MARHQEPLHRGLVTIRDPALLQEGELAFIRNAVYLPNSNALQRAKGRVAVGSATADDSDVDGLRDIKFDNGLHYFVAHVASSYVSAAVGDTATFGTLASGIGNGSQLEVVHYRNRFFLFNGFQATATGVGSNRVVYLSATGATVPTVRQHGMMPVVSSPTVTASATGFSQSVTGYYEYWVTEVAKFDQDGVQFTMESGFEANPTTIYVSATGMAPQISLPGPLQNPAITTHWRIYRSTKKDREADKVFPTGFMIAELGTATANALDSIAISSASSFPSLVNTGTNQFSDFASASSITSDNGVYATATGGALAIRSQGNYSYNFGGFSGAVKGIIVQFEAYATNGPVLVSVRIGRKRDPGTGSFLPDLSGIPNAQMRQAFGEAVLRNNTASKSVLITATASPGQIVTLGSSTDRWFAPDLAGLNDTDFSGTFMTVISAMRAAGSLEFFVDYIKTTVHYGGTIDSVVPFPTVAYTFGDIVAQVSKNGPSPSSSTGDMFEDCLVVNDVSNPSLIRWSYPGDPEAFPGTYYLDFETRQNDRVTNIKVVNGRLIVALDSSIWRVNYLPSERDASFDRGKAIECISRTHGCPNEMCATVFTPDGGPERLAFVSDVGVHVTDGYNLETWSDALDWRGDRDTTGIANPATSANYTPIALVNDHENEQLAFYFRNDSVGFGGRHYALTFQYSDMIDGKPRIAGMVTMDNRDSASGNRANPKSAWPIIRSNGVTEMFFGYGASGVGSTAAGAGQVWRESGTTIPSPNKTMQYRTRRFYLAGMGNEWKLGEMYGYCGLSSSMVNVNYATVNRKTNSSAEYGSSKTFTFSGSTPPEALHKVTHNQMCEGVQIIATVSGEGTYAQEYLIIDGEGFGEESAGTS